MGETWSDSLFLPSFLSFRLFTLEGIRARLWKYRYWLEMCSVKRIFCLLTMTYDTPFLAWSLCRSCHAEDNYHLNLIIIATRFLFHFCSHVRVVILLNWFCHASYPRSYIPNTNCSLQKSIFFILILQIKVIRFQWIVIVVNYASV